MSPKSFIFISCSVFILGALIVVLIGMTNPFFTLNENQIMYLYSTSAQVLAGIYGLTLTGFIFFRNELSREESDDDSLMDAVERLKKRYFTLLMFITGLTIISLLFSNLVISIESGSDFLLITVLMNFTQVSYIVSLGCIAYFIFDVIDPKRVERVSRDIQNEVDPDVDNEDKGSLEVFLKNFNQVEYILQEYSREFQQDYNYKYSTYRKKMSNPRLVQVLLQAEKIDNELSDEIKQLITLRNSIVHGASPTVSAGMVDRSRQVLLGLSKSLNIQVPTN